MHQPISLVWFRQDLRISDHPALAKAADLGPILPIYIYDDCAPAPYALGGASKVWLYQTLCCLNESLKDCLNIYVGKPAEIIEVLRKSYDIQHVFYNTCYEPWHRKQEEAVVSTCAQAGVDCESFNANYLWSPDQVLKDDGSYYRVFSAYKRKSLQITARCVVASPVLENVISDKKHAVAISDLALLPVDSGWSRKIEGSWTMGEQAAHAKLDDFIENRLSGYKVGRDFPMKGQTSSLSPHLHFGEISPVQIWHAVQSADAGYGSEADREHFLSELIWREFSCYLLAHFQQLHDVNFNAKFDAFPWQTDTSLFKVWSSGHTGYPIIDAGMRQLWQTGTMHNRVRMIVASFLVKNLLIDWRMGRDWFWDCLVDADLANNSASWQWVAGCGVDAAPYFRIFNPVTQGERFDKTGDYTREYVPELRALPDKYLFKPWAAPDSVLSSCGVVLGETYPQPIIDLTASRNRALEAYKSIRSM